MLTDADIALGVAALGVGAWTYNAIMDGLHYPVRAVVLLTLAIGMLTVSLLVANGSGLAILVSSFNRALVAGVGIVVAVRLTRQRLGSRRRAGRDDS